LAISPPPRNDVAVNRARACLAHALAVLLLVQWAIAPVHCLLLAAGSSQSAFICHADPDPAHHPGNGVIPSDQCCAACPALAHTTLPSTPAAAPQRVTWLVSTPQAPVRETAATVHHASPLQPRAPPAIPV
jgi:hypothetical protein